MVHLFSFIKYKNIYFRIDYESFVYTGMIRKTDVHTV